MKWDYSQSPIWVLVGAFEVNSGVFKTNILWNIVSSGIYGFQGGDSSTEKEI